MPCCGKRSKSRHAPRSGSVALPTTSSSFLYVPLDEVEELEEGYVLVRATETFVLTMYGQEVHWKAFQTRAIPLTSANNLKAAGAPIEWNF